MQREPDVPATAQATPGGRPWGGPGAHLAVVKQPVRVPGLSLGMPHCGAGGWRPLTLPRSPLPSCPVGEVAPERVLHGLVVPVRHADRLLVARGLEDDPVVL